MSEAPRPSYRLARMIAGLLPFADAASTELPLSRLLRLSLFQVSVGMAMVLLSGTLNRVMVVELGTPTWLIALLIAVPLVVAPFRALIGHRSDRHVSALGWRRVPYIWFGTMMQFGGLAIMPFALLLLELEGRFELGLVAAAVAFLLTGTGFHVTQTAGLALATDLAPEDKRPRAVALLYVMLLVGMMLSAFVIGGLLIGFATVLLMLVRGNVFGATGVLAGFMTPSSSSDWAWRATLIAGMLTGPFAILLFTGGFPVIEVPMSRLAMIVGGFIVGIGVTYGSGCTSGHGVCGLARLSPRSIAATATFMLFSFITVYVIRHVIGG